MASKLVATRMNEQSKSDFDEFCCEVDLGATNASAVYAKAAVYLQCVNHCWYLEGRP
jgi:hypothetical protein